MPGGAGGGCQAGGRGRDGSGERPAFANVTNSSNDILLGSAAHNLVRGYAGHDLLDAGDDLLLGGREAALLTGGDGDDLLIGGTIALDHPNAALLALPAPTGVRSRPPGRACLLGKDPGIEGKHFRASGERGSCTRIRHTFQGELGRRKSPPVVHTRTGGNTPSGGVR